MTNVLAALRGTKKLDLFECARVDSNYTVEHTIGVLKGLVEEGRFDHIGMSQFEKVARTLKVDASDAAERVDHITSGIVGAFVSARADLVADPDGEKYADRLVEAVTQRASARGWMP